LTGHIACNIIFWMKAYVLDTDVMVAAFRSSVGASRKILEAALARKFELLLSVPLMLEYEAVLTRPEHLAASGASKEDVGAVLDKLANIATRVRFAIPTRPTLRDADDEMVLETAVNGNADAIVTFNDQDFRPVAERFWCSVMRPGEALRALLTEGN
jgi:putative PIN family toxin of toxin-antitoxin system